jgi:CRISPR-associated protein Csh1
VIDAVSRIGNYIQMTYGGDNLLSTFIENPNSNGKYKFVLIVILKETEGNYLFSHIAFDEFSDYPRYLYKKGPSNGTDATPTSKVAGDIGKTFQNRFLKWFQNYETYDISEEEKESLKKMNMALRDQKETILAELNEKFSQKKSD